MFQHPGQAVAFLTQIANDHLQQLPPAAKKATEAFAQGAVDAIERVLAENEELRKNQRKPRTPKPNQGPTPGCTPTP